MTRFDSDLYDGKVILASDHRRGLWCFETYLGKRGNRPLRTGGALPLEASGQTLLAVGLTSALRNISRAQAADLVRAARQEITKPRIEVVTVDLAFAEALTAKMKRQVGRPWRVGKNFETELARQLSRFTISMNKPREIDNGQILAMRSWAVKTIYDPKIVEQIPAAFAPTVVSSLF
jgi:hypothetical protein